MQKHIDIRKENENEIFFDLYKGLGSSENRIPQSHHLHWLRVDLRDPAIGTEGDYLREPPPPQRDSSSSGNDHAADHGRRPGRLTDLLRFH